MPDVLDTHTHAWAGPTPERPWTNGALVADVNGFDVDAVYPAKTLLREMDETGIDRAVVVGYPIWEWTDNSYTVAVARQFDRLDAVVMADPFDEAAPAKLREEMAVDGVLGFRLAPICSYDAMWRTFDPSADWLTDAVEQTAFWEAARETEAAVQLLVHAEQLDQVLDLVEAYPDLTYLVDHFAHVGPETPPGEGVAGAFADLAEHDGVAVKVSEVVHRSAEAFPYADMHDHLRHLLDLFGRERVVWGSDYPNVSDQAGYGATLRWLDRVDGLSTSDRQWLTGRAFRRHVPQA